MTSDSERSAKLAGVGGGSSASAVRLAVVDAPLLRLALTTTEAADALGVSPDFFAEHIRPELRLVRRGRKVLVPVRELERWLEASAARTLEQGR